MELLALFEAARRLGPVKVVVRNRYAVLERMGIVKDARRDGAFLRIAGSTFQLTLDSARLGCAFALEEERPAGPKRSLVLPDLAGTPAAKLVLREGADLVLFEELRTALNRCQLPISPPKRASPGGPVNAALEDFLRSAAALGTPLGITVRNASSSLQTKTAVQRIKRSERAPWINVIDPALHLHLFEREIATLGVERPLEGAVLHWFASDGTEAFSAALPEWPLPIISRHGAAPAQVLRAHRGPGELLQGGG